MYEEDGIDKKKDGMDEINEKEGMDEKNEKDDGKEEKD